MVLKLPPPPQTHTPSRERGPRCFKGLFFAFSLQQVTTANGIAASPEPSSSDPAVNIADSASVPEVPASLSSPPMEAVSEAAAAPSADMTPVTSVPPEIIAKTNATCEPVDAKEMTDSDSCPRQTVDTPKQEVAPPTQRDASENAVDSQLQPVEVESEGGAQVDTVDEKVLEKNEKNEEKKLNIEENGEEPAIVNDTDSVANTEESDPVIMKDKTELKYKYRDGKVLGILLALHHKVFYPYGYLWVCYEMCLSHHFFVEGEGKGKVGK